MRRTYQLTDYEANDDSLQAFSKAYDETESIEPLTEKTSRFLKTYIENLNIPPEEETPKKINVSPKTLKRLYSNATQAIDDISIKKKNIQDVFFTFQTSLRWMHAGISRTNIRDDKPFQPSQNTSHKENRNNNFDADFPGF